MIVGFAGAAGSGKDTAGEAIIGGMGFKKQSFAKPLKDMLDQLFGWEPNWDSLEWKEAPNDQAYGLTPRYIAQTFGTDWGRNMINSNLWVDRAIHAALLDSSTPNHVFTDVRFPNEAAAIREAGGIVIFVRCIDRETGTENTEHESESWLEWLFHYADCDIAAQFGEIEKLQEAAIAVVDNYLNEDLPRYEPGPEILKLLHEIEAEKANA